MEKLAGGGDWIARVLQQKPPSCALHALQLLAFPLPKNKIQGIKRLLLVEEPRKGLVHLTRKRCVPTLKHRRSGIVEVQLWNCCRSGPNKTTAGQYDTPLFGRVGKHNLGNFGRC